MDKQTWEARRVCIGGSDAPAVMNLSRFGRTPMSVWADKVGLTEFNEQDQTLRQWVMIPPMDLRLITQPVLRRTPRVKLW